jgi:hypothetical protein
MPSARGIGGVGVAGDEAEWVTLINHDCSPILALHYSERTPDEPKASAREGNVSELRVCLVGKIVAPFLRTFKTIEVGVFKVSAKNCAKTRLGYGETPNIL